MSPALTSAVTACVSAAIIIISALRYRKLNGSRGPFLGFVTAAAVPLCLGNLQLLVPWSLPWLRLVRPELSWLPALSTLILLGQRPDSARPWYRAAWATLACWCIGVALAGPVVLESVRAASVVLLVDRSRSIDDAPEAWSRLDKEIRVARQSMGGDDRLAILSFAATTHLDSPFDVPNPGLAQHAETPRDATNIEQAIVHGLSALPSGEAGRLVLISDGNATRGNVEDGIAAARTRGVPIDTLALDLHAYDNLRLLSLEGPGVVNEGEPFSLRAVVETNSPCAVTAHLKRGGVSLRKLDATVAGGRDVLLIPAESKSPGVNHLEVSLEPHADCKDRHTEDNQAGTFVRVRGRSSALLLTQDPKSTRPLVLALQQAGFWTKNAGLYEVPARAAELLAYDLVVLEDIPARLMAPHQMSALERYVTHLGGGLLLMGSPNGLGAGGYAGTPLEHVSPVSFDVRSPRHRGKTAMVLALDHSGSMADLVGSRMKSELAADAAQASANSLAPEDELGVVQVDTQPVWTIPLNLRPPADVVARRLRETQPGGGGIFADVALSAAYEALERSKAAVRHVVLLCDGADVEHLRAATRLARSASDSGITTSIVSLGPGAEDEAIKRLADRGGGRYHALTSPEELPAIFSEETLLASRRVLQEGPFLPSILSSGEVLAGIRWNGMPPLLGYVATTKKARAQVLLQSPSGDPVLALWQVGLGHVATFTSDYNGRWGRNWLAWPQASQLFAQLGRYLVRTTEDVGLQVTRQLDGAVLHVVADALDGGGFLDTHRVLAVHLSDPDGRTTTREMHSTIPGHYEAEFTLSTPGAHAISVVELRSGQLVGTSGVELSAADELTGLTTDRALLERIAKLTGGRTLDTLAGLFDDPTSLQRRERPVGDLLAALAIVAVLGLSGASLMTGRVGIRWLAKLRGGRAAAVSAAPHRAASGFSSHVPTAAERMLRSRTKSQREDGH